MLAICALIALQRPSKPLVQLVAVYDPLTKAVWNGAGRRITSSVSQDLRVELSLAASTEAPGQGGTRVFAFRLRDPKTDSMMVSSRQMTWNGGSLPSFAGPKTERLGVKFFTARIAPRTDRLDLTVTLGIGTATTIVDFKMASGHVIAKVGKERHPRVVSIPPGYEISPLGAVRRPSTSLAARRVPMFAVIFDDKYDSPCQSSANAWNTKGNLIQMESSGGLYKMNRSSNFLGDARSLSRFVATSKPIRHLSIQNVPMDPTGK